MSPRKLVLATIALTVGALSVIAALVAGVVIYGGLYNVASTEQHLQPTFTLMETAMRQSVRLRARGIEVPPLHDERMLLNGAACFRDKCVQCHGAPGVAQGDIGKSLQPLPGPLVDARKHWKAHELFWVTRQGIKMSGMPAWQYRLSDTEIWSVVAFMQRLPELNAGQYAALLQRAPPAPSCGREMVERPASMPGDIERGKRALFQYACNACHTIPGVTGSSPQVGPSLQGMAGRTLIAGVLSNTPEQMERWLRQTQQVKPLTAMPQLDVSAQDARDIAAYLATLR